MQAVFILLVALVVGVAAWLAAWYHTRAPSHPGADQELTRLGNHAVWLEQRLDTARRERWDPAMIVALSDQLGGACQQLACAQLLARTPAPAGAH